MPDVTLSIRLDSIKFSGGQSVLLGPGTIVVLVGPNNAGKSRALREIRDGLSGNKTGLVVTDVRATNLGDDAALSEWISTQLVGDSDDRRYGQVVGLGGRANTADLFRGWPNAPHPVMVRQLCLLATAEHRFAILKAPKAINPLRDPSVHPIHYLLKHQEYEGRLDAMLQRAFGEGFVVNWASGEYVQIHVGDKPTTEDRVSSAYLSALDAVPILEEHGDGLRSFVGCALQVLLGPWSVVLLDEPEVFLHPPQAELLGQWLASEVPADRQMVIATHSADLVRGLLRAQSSRVKLIRLRRAGDVNEAHVLESGDVESISHDPALRFTNLLNSLFHAKNRSV